MEPNNESRAIDVKGESPRNPSSLQETQANAAGPKMRAWPGRSGPWAVVLVIIAVVTGGIYVAVWPPASPPDEAAQRSRAASTATTAPPAPQVKTTTEEEGRLPLDPLVPETAAEQLAEGERIVDDLARRFPKNPDAHEMQARFHYEFGQVDRAVAAWQRCLELDLNYAYAHIGLAQSATGRGAHDEAVAHCRRAVLADPNRPSHQIDLAQALVTVGELDEALEVLERVVKAVPGSARAQSTLGTAQLQKRNYEAAKTAFEAALRQDPTHAQAHFGLATACARLGLAEQARDHEAKFREFRDSRHQELRGQRASYDDDQALREDLAVRYTEVASVYLAERRPAVAEQLWRRAARLDPKNRDCRQALAWLLLKQEKPLETIRMLREVAQLEPANPSCHAEIARLYSQLGRLDDAERTLCEFVESLPENAVGRLTLAEFYLNVKREPKLAVEHARKAVDLTGAAEHWFLLSAAHEVAGDLPAAMDALENAARVAPDNPQYRQLLALVKSRTDGSATTPHPVKTPSAPNNDSRGAPPDGTVTPNVPQRGD